MEIFTFILIVALCVGGGFFGGKQLLGYFSDTEAEDAPQKAINGAIAILVAVVLAVSFFLVTKPEGRTEATVSPSGAWKTNQNQTLPSEQELEEKRKERELKEWGEVNQKSYEEIREESNRRVKEATERNN